MKPLSHKTFQNTQGRWIEKTTKSEILVCSSCKTKYLKTRKVQVVCIKCMFRPAPQK